jgi:hypothetical protein
MLSRGAARLVDRDAPRTLLSRRHSPPAGRGRQWHESASSLCNEEVARFASVIGRSFYIIEAANQTPPAEALSDLTRSVAIYGLHVP